MPGTYLDADSCLMCVLTRLNKAQSYHIFVNFGQPRRFLGLYTKYTKKCVNSRENSVDVLGVLLGMFSVLVGILGVFLCTLDVFCIEVVYLLHFVFGKCIYGIFIAKNWWVLFIKTLN